MYEYTWNVFGCGAGADAVPDDSDLELTIAIMSGPDDGLKASFRRGDGHGSTGVGGAWVLTLGRRDDCDLCLPFDTQISRLHARLIYQPDTGWTLEDSGSRNGTFVGKKRIEGAVHLEAGTLFRIGRTWLRLEKTGR